MYLALLGCTETCREVAGGCSLSPEPAASGYSVSQKIERSLCVLLRMVGNPCLGKTEGWSTKGEKGQACHGVEDVQSSPSRGWEEKWGAGRAQGYSKSKGCLSLVPKPEQRWQSWHWGALREMQNTWKAPAKGAGLDIRGLDCASQLACEWG